MKIKPLTIILSLSILASSAAFADGSCQVLGSQNGTTYNGLTHCSHVTLSQIRVNGPLKASDLTVNGNVLVNGPVDAKNITIKGNAEIHGPLNASKLIVGGDIRVSGPLSIDGDSNIKGNIIINGPLVALDSHFSSGASNTVLINGPIRATNSQFKGSVTYAADLSTLDSSTFSNIRNKDSNKHCPQVLDLENKTRVNGNVSFKSNCGEIHLSGGSRISGRVTGAKVTH